MIPVDTSVWVEHLRSGYAALADELGTGRVLTHPSTLIGLKCTTLPEC